VLAVTISFLAQSIAGVLFGTLGFWGTYAVRSPSVSVGNEWNELDALVSAICIGFPAGLITGEIIAGIVILRVLNLKQYVAPAIAGLVLGMIIGLPLWIVLLLFLSLPVRPELLLAFTGAGGFMLGALDGWHERQSQFSESIPQNDQ
jgi:hypothetical protein